MARVNDLEHELRKVVAGDVRFDPISRLLYSTDASMYQVEPIGVVIPRDADDVQAAVEVARKHQVALLPRGGGTSLTGQTVNRALVLDFARHMNRVLEVNSEERWARVEPGLVQDELNHHVRPTGLLFGPDTSTSNRATLGGMLGNNSGGSHSIAYGLTVDHVIEVTALLADGTRVVFGDITRAELEAKGRRSGLEGQIYRDLQEPLESSQSILETGPYAVELTDKMILDLARENIEQSQRMGFVQGDPAAILIVEYAGESDAEVRAKVAELEARRQRERFGYAATLAFDPVEQQSIWKLRKAGLGLLLGMKGDKKPIAFVEDTAVHPKHLAEFVPRVRDVFAKHDAVGAYYGHCSVGCLHIRPVINLKTPRGLEQVRAIADEITSLVLEFGGTISSEHGDGRARSPFLERMYGPRLMRAFRELKRAFDPENRMNPGNLVDSPGIVENLRYGVGYTTWEPATLLDFSGQGGFAAAVELCNGVGVCRKTLEGTMCPSYMATKDEEHSTRGRADALRAVLSGTLPPSEFTGKRLYEVMDLCLECKGCKAECPSNVDMAKLKYEFLHHYYEAHGLPLRNRLFGRIERLNRLGARLPGLVNWISDLGPSRWALEKIAGIDRRRPLPALAAQTFTDWFARRPPPLASPPGGAVLFPATFVTYNTPEIGRAAVELLEAAGYHVALVDKKCCGRPLISKGMLAEARAHAAWNVARLAPYARRSIPIVGLEPSCLLTLRDESVDLLRTDDARAVARHAFLLDEFLQRERTRGLELRFAGDGRKVLLHGHCHQKALVGTAPTVAALQWAGFRVEEIDSGCCGMAGSFGFEREHYDISVSLGNRRLVPAVKAAAADTVIAAAGVSCRPQIEHLTGRRAVHPAEG